MSKDFNVAIVGGGMCGLACAVGLRRAGIDVTVFESAPKFEQVGAGVALDSNALRALQGVGVLEPMLAQENLTTLHQRHFLFVSETGEQVYDYAEHGPPNVGFGVYRPRFVDALLPLLDSGVAKFNKRCVSVGHASSGRPVVHFADNTSYEADLVIGADGIKSATRNAVVSDAQISFSDTHIYRALIPMDDLKSAGINTTVQYRTHCFTGLGKVHTILLEDPEPKLIFNLIKHIITFPIMNNTVLNVAAFVREKDNFNFFSLSPERPVPWVEDASHQDVMDDYSGWTSDGKIILQHIKQPTRWAIHCLYPPLKTFVNEKVVLVGDAAHGMLTHLGAGAGQGFEDVYALCRLLSLPTTTKSNLDVVLNVYDSVRRPRANMILERSIKHGSIIENFGPGHYSAEDMRRHLRGMWEPVLVYDLEAEVTKAIEAMTQK